MNTKWGKAAKAVWLLGCVGFVPAAWVLTGWVSPAGMALAAPHHKKRPVRVPRQTQQAAQNLRYKVAIQEFEEGLSGLEPWQKRLFKEEVIPQAPKFIQGYTPGGLSELSATVDGALIKKYIAFYGPTRTGVEEPKLVVYLQPDSSCSKCVKSSTVVRSLARARMLRRGFDPILMEPEDLELVQGGEAREVEDKLDSLVAEKKASGWLWIRWDGQQGSGSSAVGAMEDDEDSVGSEFRMVMAIRIGKQTLRKQARLEDESERFESLQARMLNEMMVELADSAPSGGVGLSAGSDASSQGVKGATAGAGKGSGKGEGSADGLGLGELNDSGRGLASADSGPGAGVVIPAGSTVSKTIGITGIKDFAQMTRIKASIQAGVKDFVSIQEQAVSRGEATFRVEARGKVEDLTGSLEKVKLDPEGGMGLDRTIE